MLSGYSPASHSFQEHQQFVSRQIGVNSHFAWQVSNRGAGFQAVWLAIMPKDGGLSRGGAQEVEQDSDGGSLAGAVKPEESKDLTTRNLQVKMIYSDESAIAFGQSTN